jgi:hypothetical protein
MDRIHESLSDEDLDAQLNAFNDNMEGVMTGKQTGKTASGGFRANVNDVIAQAFQRIEKISERDETVDAAVKAAAHGVKVLAPILQATSKHGATPEQANALMGKVLMRTNAGTNKVLEAYGLREGEAPAWLSATVSGQVIKLITNSLNEGNLSILDKPDDSFIQPLIDYAQAATKLGAVAYASSTPELEIANALMMATCNVMAEYQCFNYFHEDATKISQEISTYFNERVVRGTLDELTDRFALKPFERTYMANSLLSSAGEMMAQSWKSGVPDTIANLRGMPKEARQAATANGYPLSAIIERFESVYQGIELSCESAIRTLNPGREQSKADMEHNKGLRVG